jgi:predicted nucleic acid-binding protein
MNYVVDTGVLVAYLNRRDNLHEWACNELGKVSPPLLTCEAVVAECCYLLQGSGGDEAILKMIEDGYIQIPFVLSQHIKEVGQTLTKYKSQKVSLADASLVRMLELIKGGVLLTTDSDFDVYRIHRHRRIIKKSPN